VSEQAIINVVPGARAIDVETLLRERIARREIPPGAKLREEALAEEFNVSRARIRQALSVLHTRGLVERIPNKGSVVATFDAERIFKIYDVFEMLEGLCARLAVQNTKPESWQDLVELFGPTLHDTVMRGECEPMHDAVEVYRTRVIEAADNPTLNDFLDRIWDITEVIIRRTLILPGRAEQSFKEHAAIVQAMRAGDAEKAELLKRENMRSARQALQKYREFVL
jgi:DNA-binding GntR family transcriptional regulator